MWHLLRWSLMILTGSEDAGIATNRRCPFCLWTEAEVSVRWTSQRSCTAKVLSFWNCYSVAHMYYSHHLCSCFWRCCQAQNCPQKNCILQYMDAGLCLCTCIVYLWNYDIALLLKPLCWFFFFVSHCVMPNLDSSICITLLNSSDFLEHRPVCVLQINRFLM